MGKLFAILAASAAVAGGATFAFFHYADPYHCPLSGCEVAKVGCCSAPDACSPEAPMVAAAGPVALFATVPVSADAPCCSAKAGRACCAVGGTACTDGGALTAVVGPASVR